ncbi:hypothetical protein TESG_07205 [Trichophyton tonsurans CBS 112818]|uniref:Uncharacterized protein n=1 Tax=Trichophyton tonsurans (strain CBS 112818) TaxID=647933 RepID=F2S8H0_TRIT1|nr:hypothetical protein TESG_07205 [Trichophyton tonsurans CBS 112818]
MWSTLLSVADGRCKGSNCIEQKRPLKEAPRRSSPVKERLVNLVPNNGAGGESMWTRAWPMAEPPVSFVTRREKCAGGAVKKTLKRSNRLPVPVWDGSSGYLEARWSMACHLTYNHTDRAVGYYIGTLVSEVERRILCSPVPSPQAWVHRYLSGPGTLMLGAWGRYTFHQLGQTGHICFIISRSISNLNRICPVIATVILVVTPRPSYASLCLTIVVARTAVDARLQRRRGNAAALRLQTNGSDVSKPGGQIDNKLRLLSVVNRLLRQAAHLHRPCVSLHSLRSFERPITNALLLSTAARDSLNYRAT